MSPKIETPKTNTSVLSYPNQPNLMRGTFKSSKIVEIKVLVSL
jgi:hypothetical protein